MKIAFNPSTVAALIAPPNNKDITFDLRGHNIFARGVKFCGTDTNTWRDIKINNVSIDSNILDLRDGDNTTLTNINGVVTINSTWRPVVDNLTSDSTTSSLSANQGRILKALIDGKSDSGHNHDDRYLRLTGGWMSGDINFGGDNKIYWGRNTDSASISFKNDGDGDADSYMSFVTSDNGNEYFRWSHSSGSTNTEWMALRSDGLRVGGTKVSLEGHSHNDLYYTKTEVNNKLNGKSDTGHTHDDRYLKLTGGIVNGVVGINATGVCGNSVLTVGPQDKRINTGIVDRYGTMLQIVGTGKKNEGGVIGFHNPGLYSAIIGFVRDTNETGFIFDTDVDRNSWYVKARAFKGNLIGDADSVDGIHMRWSHNTRDTWIPVVSDGNLDYILKSELVGQYNSASATKLQTPRSIWGQSFDGTGNVDNTLRIRQTTSNWCEGIRIQNGDNTWATIILGATSDYGTNDNAWSIHRKDDNNFAISRNSSDGTNGLVMTSVGMGLGTTAPYMRLHVNGDGIYLNSTATCGINMYSSHSESSISYKSSGGTRTVFGTYTNRTFLWNELIGEHVSILSSNGYFGIGTTSPSSKLTINGDISLFNVGSIRNLAIGGGIYWNPYVESASDGSDSASITLVKSGVAGGTTLVLSQMNDSNDTIQFQTNGSARLYHNSYPILTTQNTYVSNNKGYINGTEITQVNNADTVDGIDSSGFLRYYNSNSAPSNVDIVNTPSYVWTVSTTGGSVANATKPSGVDNAWGVIHLHTHIENYATQLGFGGTTNRMYMRNAYNTSTFGNWQALAFITDIPTSLPANGGNADTVDGYHASSLWRSDGGIWNPGANISLTASGNNQEWSFDIRRNGHTGCYWHVWDSDRSTMLKVNADNGKVYAPYNFVGNLEGNAYYATKSEYSRSLLGRSTSGSDYGADSSNLVFAEWNTMNDSRWYLKATGYECRVAYASSAGNAETLGGMPRNYGQAPFNTIPYVGSDGVMEIGRYIDYHYNNSGNYDFSTRLQASGNNRNVVTLPSESGTLALTSYGGDASHPIFLGYLNLDHGNDGTISSSFSCLGYSVPFTYTRGGNYCKITIPDTTYQVFYIRTATASVNYSGGGMDTWVGTHRGNGAWWLHCYASGLNEVRVKGFCQNNSHNDSWWGGNPLGAENASANKITVCIFGYVTFR